jgi:hypothetical protein
MVCASAAPCISTRKAAAVQRKKMVREEAAMAAGILLFLETNPFSAV